MYFDPISVHPPKMDPCFFKIRGTSCGGPHNKDYGILGSILGYNYFLENKYFGKLPNLPGLSPKRSNRLHQ